MKPYTDLRQDLKLYRRLLRYAWPYKWAFVVALVGMALASVTASGFAALMKPLVDEGFVQQNADMIRRMPIYIVSLFILRGLASFLGEYTITWVSRRVTADLRNACFTKMLRLPCGFFDVNAPGTLIAKLIFNVEQIAGAVTQAIFVVVGDGLTALALLGYLAWLNWKLTLMLIIVAPISMVLVRIMSKGFRRASQKIQGSIGEISRVTQEATSGYRVVRAFGGEAREQERFAEANERNRKQAVRKSAIGVVGMALVQIVGAVGLSLVIYFALADKTISAGEFVSYIVATTWLMGPMRRLAKINEVIQTGLAAAGSAFALLDEEAERDDGTKTLDRARGRVEYRNVTFRYFSGRADALHEVSFVVEPGKTLALVGASGSGKTTLASLLPRFYRATSGQILIDGVDINALALDNLRSQIALVGQETLLFDDTIANNIAYGSTNPVDRERLLEAARIAHVIEFAERLPQGLDTRVGEKGALLSGGQKQRVAIARAIYKNAPILILDEATSALDSESERFVQDAMRKLQADRTTLVIAHRLSTVEHADRIVVLARGAVVESGTHRELLARGGAYASLHQSQFANVG